MATNHIECGTKESFIVPKWSILTDKNLMLTMTPMMAFENGMNPSRWLLLRERSNGGVRL